MRLQDDFGQKFAVIGYAHDTKLQTARFIARQQEQRQLQAIVDLAVGLQARVLVLLPGVQFGKNFFVAGRGKDHGTLLCWNCRRMILKGSQFIRQRNTANTGVDPVNGVHEVAGMEQRRHAGTAPRIGAAITMQKRQKQRWRRLQLGFFCQKYIDVGGIRCCDDLRQPQSACDIRFPIRWSLGRRQSEPRGAQNAITARRQIPGFCRFRKPNHLRGAEIHNFVFGERLIEFF